MVVAPRRGVAGLKTAPQRKHHMNRRNFFRFSLAALATIGIGGGYRGMTNPYYAGPVTDHFDGTRFFVPGEKPVNSFTNLMRWQFGSDPRASWPAVVPSTFNDVPPPRFESAGIRSVLIGHASFLVQVAGLNILIDPVFSERTSPVSFAGPKRFNPPGIDFDKLPPIDLVLVTHSHYDHMDAYSLKALQAGHKPRFIAPLGNDALMEPFVGDRRNVAVLDWGQSIDAGQGVTIHLVPTFHWGARGLTDRRKTLWGSFVITTPSGTIYHIGDTGYGDGRFSRDVAKQFGPIALAHIPIGAYEPRWFMQSMHVNPQEAVQIFQDCGATKAIGHHWGTFQLTNEAHDLPEKDLAIALQAANIKAQRFEAFRPGQVLVV
jgi:L-ascorbate metabolism protein UlaG (beta-lactamase superfamily)